MMKRQILIIIVGFAIMAAAPIFSAAGEKFFKKPWGPSFVLEDADGNEIGTVIAVAAGYGGSNDTAHDTGTLIITTLIEVSTITGSPDDRLVALAVTGGGFHDYGVLAFTDTESDCPSEMGEFIEPFVEPNTGAPPDISPVAIVDNKLYVATGVANPEDLTSIILDNDPLSMCQPLSPAVNAPVAPAEQLPVGSFLTDVFPEPYNLIFE